MLVISANAREIAEGIFYVFFVVVGLSPLLPCSLFVSLHHGDVSPSWLVVAARLSFWLPMGDENMYERILPASDAFTLSGCSVLALKWRTIYFEVCLLDIRIDTCY